MWNYGESCQNSLVLSNARRALSQCNTRRSLTASFICKIKPDNKAFVLIARDF